MNNSDLKEFSRMWAVSSMASASTKPIDKTICDYAFGLLMDFDLQDVLNAIKKHSQINKFAPTPSDIISILAGSKNSHINADEAWALALKAFDENETVVVTPEILEAKAAVQEIYDTGDIVGTRMGFRAAYERIMLSARHPVWQVSSGYDATKRLSAVAEGVRLGRLPPGSENKYRLEAPKAAGAIAGLLTGKVSELPTNSQVLKSRWKELKTALNDGVMRAEEQKRLQLEDDIKKRLDFEQRRIDTMKFVKAVKATESA